MEVHCRNSSLSVYSISNVFFHLSFKFCQENGMTINVLFMVY